jgi:DNA adenine methylase
MKRVDVIFGDGIKFLSEHSLQMPTHSLVYIDPPYVTNGYKLYRYHFERAQHEALSNAVNSLCVPWLISYDNHQLIRDLYSGEQTKYVKTYQSLKGSRFMKEILLLSEDFALPPSDGAARSSRNRGSAHLLNYDN